MGGAPASSAAKATTTASRVSGTPPPSFAAGPMRWRRGGGAAGAGGGRPRPGGGGGGGGGDREGGAGAAVEGVEREGGDVGAHGGVEAPAIEQRPCLAGPPSGGGPLLVRDGMDRRRPQAELEGAALGARQHGRRGGPERIDRLARRVEVAEHPALDPHVVAHVGEELLARPAEPHVGPVHAVLVDRAVDVVDL